MSRIGTLLAAAAGALFRALFGRWLGTRDIQTKGLEHAVEAEKEDARVFAAPARDKPAVVERLRRHESD